MRLIYVVFSCDSWHMNNSKVPLAYCSTFDRAVEQTVDRSKNSDEGVLNSDEIAMVYNFNQTQNREENYIIQEQEVSTPQ